MNSMFARCYVLESIDVSSFDTSKVEDMVWMFRMCYKLKSLDISNFDTSKCVYFYYMFEGCSELENLELGNLNTENVINFEGMFTGCKKLKTTIPINAQALVGATIGQNDYDYAYMLNGAATAEGAQITIRYKASQKDIIDKMVETKSANSNIVLEVVAE